MDLDLFALAAWSLLVKMMPVSIYCACILLVVGVTGGGNKNQGGKSREFVALAS